MKSKGCILMIAIVCVLALATPPVVAFGASPRTQMPLKDRPRERPPEPTPEPTPKLVRYSDIAHAYHGLLLDSELQEIQLDNAVIEHLQDSMIESLTAVPEVEEIETADETLIEQQHSTPPLDPAYVEEVLTGFKFSADERILTKSALIQTGIDEAPPGEKGAYQWRFDLIHENSLNFLHPEFRFFRPEFESYLITIGLFERIRRLLERWRPIPDYIFSCIANSVPIPPDWPSDRWKPQGVLPSAFTFASADKVAEVYTYEAPEGLAYALPRRLGGEIHLLGIISQSKATGKACFWDNVDPSTGRIKPVITLRIAEVMNGDNLAENCTNCHRGGNAFLIHPETPLGAPDAAIRNPNVRYTPISGQVDPSTGQATWVNPSAFAPRTSGACAGCHEIAAPTPSYCALLRFAAERTMPNPTAPAGWISPSPAYAAHISEFKDKAMCP